MTPNFPSQKFAFALLFVVALSFVAIVANAQVPNNGGEQATAASILIPNAFSPNGDGLDDVFNIIVDENAEVIDFRVYNRFGNAVWSANKNIGWDGTLNGQPQPVETYVYTAVVLDKITGQKVFKQGDVTLIR